MQLSKITIAPADVNDLTSVASQVLAQALAGLVQGAEADVQTYAANIVSIGVAAGLAGDTDTLGQLADQARALLEVNRLQAVAASQAVIGQLINLTVNFAVKLAANAALPGLGGLVPAINVMAAKPFIPPATTSRAVD